MCKRRGADPSVKLASLKGDVGLWRCRAPVKGLGVDIRQVEN